LFSIFSVDGIFRNNYSQNKNDDETGFRGHSTEARDSFKKVLAEVIHEQLHLGLQKAAAGVNRISSTSREKLPLRKQKLQLTGFQIKDVRENTA
jgi:hypothetical protein